MVASLENRQVKDVQKVRSSFETVKAMNGNSWFKITKMNKNGSFAFYKL